MSFGSWRHRNVLSRERKEEKGNLIVTSKITGKSYDSDKVIYITYIAQIAFYFQMGCDYEVLDILWDNSKNQKRPLCVVFRRSQRMKELYELWKEHSHKEETNGETNQI